MAMKINSVLRTMQYKWKRFLAPDQAHRVTDSGADVGISYSILEMKMHFIRYFLTFSNSIASNNSGDRSVGVSIFTNNMKCLAGVYVVKDYVFWSGVPA